MDSIEALIKELPPMFTGLLADQLSATCPLPVREGKAGQIVKPGGVWLAPGGFDMTVGRYGSSIQLMTNGDPAENSCRPSADVLFRSANSLYGGDSLALIMTGMGSDGLRGCEAIRASGGQILAQDEASSVVWGMPGAVSQAGLAEKVLPLAELALEINKRVQAIPVRTALATQPVAAFSRTLAKTS